MRNFYSFFIALAFIGLSGAANAQIFSAVNDDGIILNYQVTSATAVALTGGKKVTGNLNIPNSVTDSAKTYSVTSIGNGAFAYCGNLKSVAVPNSVTTIGDAAFYYCDNLTSITMGNAVTTIGDYTFYNCDSLTAAVIPNSVTAIGFGAFAYCSGLTTITIPSSVTSIINAPFGSCAGLTAINVDAGNPNYSSADGILFNKNKTELIQYPKGKQETSYVIPSTVTAIGDYAFYNCNGLTAVSIPNSVTSIGDAAFNYCSFASVAVPYSIATIGEGVFLGCADLSAINVDANNPNYSADGGVLFNKDKTTLIQYPGGKQGATYSIPNSVAAIGDYAFYNCQGGLTAVTIPNSVTEIGNWAFYNCIGLTSVNIGNAVNTIGESAFSICYDLKSITIPNSVNTIGDYAFAYCSNLTSVINKNKTPQNIDSDVFYEVNLDSATLTVPECALSAYQNAAVWHTFDSLIADASLPCEDTIAEIKTQNINIYPNPVKNELFIQSDYPIEKVAICDLSGKSLLTSPKGRNSSPPSGELEGASINVSMLPASVYIIKIYANGKMTVRKFIKE